METSYNTISINHFWFMSFSLRSDDICWTIGVSILLSPEVTYNFPRRYTIHIIRVLKIYSIYHPVNLLTDEVLLSKMSTKILNQSQCREFYYPLRQDNWSEINLKQTDCGPWSCLSGSWDLI